MHMKKSLSRYNPRIDGVSQSMLSDFMHCRQMCQNKIDGWERLAAPKAHLNLGTLIHKGLEIYYMRQAKHVDGVIRAMTQFQNTLDFSSPFEREVVLGKAVTLLQAYFPYHVKKDKKFKFVEAEMEFDIEDFYGIRFRGKIDGVFEIGKELWILETKTTSQISEEIGKLIAIDFQIQSYTLAVEHVLGRKVSGVLWNGIRTPSMTVRKGDSIEMYIQRLRQDIQKRKSWYFVRYPMPSIRNTKKKFVEEFRFKVQEFLKWQDGKLPTLKNQAACRGRFYCDFLNMCAFNNTTDVSKTRKLFRELEADNA